MMIPTTLYKWAGIATALTLWTYGHRWQAVQALERAHATEAAAREATNKESQRLSEKAATNAKENYEQDKQNQRIDAKRLDGVLERVYRARPENCAPANPAGTPSPAAPQFEWNG
jgi:hypothetical protein